MNSPRLAIVAADFHHDLAETVVVLGYIEKGETLHGEVIGHTVYAALVQLQLKYKIPIGMGIIGPGATAAQAQSRAEGSARGATKAALRSLAVLRETQQRPKRKTMRHART